MLRFYTRNRAVFTEKLSTAVHDLSEDERSKELWYCDLKIIHKGATDETNQSHSDHIWFQFTSSHIFIRAWAVKSNWPKWVSVMGYLQDLVSGEDLATLANRPLR